MHPQCEGIWRGVADGRSNTNPGFNNGIVRFHSPVLQPRGHCHLGKMLVFHTRQQLRWHSAAKSISALLALRGFRKGFYKALYDHGWWLKVFIKHMSLIEWLKKGGGGQRRKRGVTMASGFLSRLLDWGLERLRAPYVIPTTRTLFIGPEFLSSSFSSSSFTASYLQLWPAL